jgi:ATP-dependent DNA helicase RecG
VLYVKEKGKITNAEYQEINVCSRNTASAELKELTNKSILEGSDVKGVGSFYQLKIIAQIAQ